MAAKPNLDQQVALALSSFGFPEGLTSFSAKTQKEDDAAFGLQEFLRTIGFSPKRSGNWIKLKKGKYTFDFNMENSWRKTSWTLEIK